MNLFEELKRRNVFRVGIAYGVAAWLLIQIADTVFPRIGLSDSAVTLVIALLAIGFIPAIIFAWAFEMTPGGLKRERDVERAESITPQTGKKLDRLITSILAVAVAYLLVDKLVLQKATEPAAQPTIAVEQEAAPTGPEAPSVAVLPFVNMSGDQENEYFSDGLTETLLHMLAQIPDLRVAARTSSFAFKGQNTSVTEIAETLGVAHILEGSVQKAQDRVRVTAQLIRAGDGFHVWSQAYTRPLEDIFAIQDEIAADVSDALGASLLGNTATTVAGVHTQDLSAYDSYLKGLEQQAIFSYGSLPLAESHFKQALARDPEFTDARLALARNYLLKNGTGLIDEQQMRSLVGPLLEQVRAEEPDNHLARALELTMELQDFDVTRKGEETRAIVDELRALLSVLPTESYIRERAAQMMFFFFNEKQTGMEIVQAGLLIDPLSADLHSALADMYRDRGRLDEGRSELRRAIDLAPDNPNLYADLSRLEKEADDLPASLEWMRRATEVDPQDHELASHIAEDLYRLELPEEGDRWTARVKALAPGSEIARNLEVQRAVARGEYDRAVELAERAISDQIGIRQNSFLDTLFTYVGLMLQAGRSQEAYDFLAATRPEIADLEQLPSDLHAMIMRWTSMALLAAIDPPEARRAKWQKFAAQLNQMGFPWLADPADNNHTVNFLMLGENDKAIDHYIEHRLQRPLALNLNRHKRMMQWKPLFTPVFEDPRVREALDEETERYAALRTEVREMLQGPEWN